MTAVFEWALANSLVALALAIPAYASSWLRRPALTHALWLIVLVRLIMPPLWHVPVAFGTTAKTLEPIAQLPTNFIDDAVSSPPSLRSGSAEEMPDEPMVLNDAIPAEAQP